MSRVRARGEEIRRYILKNVQSNPSTISKLAMEHFKVTRQAINSHFHRLVQEGSLRDKGKTRNRIYQLAAILEWKQVYLIGSGPAEDQVWRNDIDSVLGKLPENVRDIWFYGFTEMFNNARDHSGGTSIVAVFVIAATIEVQPA